MKSEAHGFIGVFHLVLNKPLKLINMVRLKFHGSEESNTSETTLEAFANDSDNIFIEIDEGTAPPSFICLEKQTAIKLVKVLKTEISKLK